MIGFEEFLQLVKDGRSPYPWQAEFANRSAGERPPEIVAVPTGCGKTTVVEALVWALAMQAERPGAERTVGVRTIWAIDRRILVDEVYAQAKNLGDLLEAAWQSADLKDPLYEVASRLQRLKDPDGNLGRREIGPPLLATRWRGGIPMSPPAQHPLQAEVITSTVGQIGSRILFRGYGLGAGSRPTGAALAACDTTICLDEAHLAEPFAATVNTIAARRREEPDLIAPPVSIIQLSATLAPENSEVRTPPLELSAEDRLALSQRLEAPKQVTLVDPESQSDKDQVAALVDAVLKHLTADSMKIACVCNSVRTARLVFDQLSRQAKKADRMLLVGPQRQADREQMFRAPVAPGNAKSEEKHPSRREVLFDGAEAAVPLVIVATQTVEVGLDIDVEAMVTQSASAGAMIQRFGRLNRSGSPGITGQATVVRQTEFPLYELDEESSWNWLNTLPPVDDSAALDISVATLAEHPPPAPRRRNPAAELSDGDIARLVETNPEPHEMADPEIDVYLRGVHSEPNNDVTLFWRSDLFEEDLDAKKYRDALLGLAPPSPAEQLSLSIGAARNLLRNLTGSINAKGATLRRQVLDGADLEGDGPDEARYNPNTDHREFEGIPYFVLRNKKWMPGSNPSSASTETVTIAQLRPGDLIVIPTALGGSDDSGLAPDSETGTDVGDDVRPIDDRSETPVRLTHGALMTIFETSHPVMGPRAQFVDVRMRRINRLADRILAAEPGSREASRPMVSLFEVLAGHPVIVSLDPEKTDVRRLTPPGDVELYELFDDEDGFDPPEDLEPEVDVGSMVAMDGEEAPGRPAEGWILIPRHKGDDLDELRPRNLEPPTLAAHCQAVADRAGQFGTAAGLNRTLLNTVTLAGLAHDLGKADPRMQGLFHGGVTPAVADLLAKSTFGTRDRSRDQAAREASGMPTGLRHEQASVGILEASFNSGETGKLPLSPINPDLLLYLVGAHHGKNHPIPPVPEGGSPPRPFRAEANGLSGNATGDGDEGWNDGESLKRATRLRNQLGPWALAYLEALLVMADRTISAEGK